MQRTSRFLALDHDFAVATDVPGLTGYLDDAFSALAVDGEAAREYTIEAVERTSGSEYRLTFDGAPIDRSTDPSRPLALLLWHVNTSAAERTPAPVLLHAAAAEHEGAGIVIPGASESGKSTLVAGLVRAGMRYLTDELTAVDRATRRLRAYPKPLSLDRGSWGLLADLEPRVAPAVRRFLPDQWQVPPDRIRPGAVAPGARPRIVVFPTYEPGAPTRLVPLGRAAALVRLTECSSSFPIDPAGTLEVLGAMVRQCRAYELVTSDLAPAVAAVVEAVPAVDDDLGSRPAGLGARAAERRPRSIRARVRTGTGTDASILGLAPRRHPRVTGVEIDGETVLCASEGLRRLDPIATVLWTCFDGSVTVGELADDLAEVYGFHERDRIRDDVARLVGELSRAGLLVGVPGPAAPPDPPVAHGAC